MYNLFYEFILYNLRDWVMGGLGQTYLLFWGVKREEGGKCVPANPTPSPPAPL